MSLPARLLGANPSIQVSSLLSGTLTTPSAKQSFGYDFESIQTVNVGAGGASTITFTNIPSSYQHLQIHYLARSSQATSTVNINMEQTGGGGSSYAWHRLFGNGTSVGAGGSSAVSASIIGQAPGSSVTAGIFSAGIIHLADYKNTNKNKTSRALGGYDGSGGAIQLFSALLQSTTTTSTITFTLSGGSFVQYSSFALYGIRGA